MIPNIFSFIVLPFCQLVKCFILSTQFVVLNDLKVLEWSISIKRNDYLKTTTSFEKDTWYGPYVPICWTAGTQKALTWLSFSVVEDHKQEKNDTKYWSYPCC